MGKRSFVLLIILLLCCSSMAPMGGSDEGGSDRGSGFLDDHPVWTDSLDDMSHVFVPSAGLVGVEVAGGEVYLIPGNTSGWVASSPIACPDGLRYDYVLLEVDTPGNSSVQ
ncbi:MAG: hypothetical protein KAQ96_04685, partial [Thermoplasmata archaeon]|nr:hypothetical protein [Thermoplasmata archaeon]